MDIIIKENYICKQVNIIAVQFEYHFFLFLFLSWHSSTLFRGDTYLMFAIRLNLPIEYNNALLLIDEFLKSLNLWYT